ncbi:MarR family winged helix-turn-helix transcriptional regulator [Paenibacillus donghaensis]|uniref:MarR family transcriptional regulator n=1 Tax=Paenibacillus donghaensis TaxID=414771 RepID=A0A2Z2KMI9_9BACL|nr:MarR family transcriptional regulator [Paenibacillus donghaensis]ASA19878.1 MarR family transcriptional regulator [Paenibacillus donghaensis]
METVELLQNLLRVLDRNIGALEKTQLACCGVTIGQCHAVMEIGLANEISLIDLAKVLNLDKSTMSRTVNNLVTDEWVERITDPENRRYVKLKLSLKGEALHQQINAVMNSYFGSVMNDIPEDKREQVAESLGLLIHALNKNNCC